MAKPRIIIADTDISYIIPLQLKFVEDFFEKIDLEIITDCNYFDELFAIPQKVDILVVSEELYSSTLQRHNICQIFVMKEKYEEEQTGDLNVNYIFKYTSIKEIFNEISGKCSDVLNVDVSTKKGTQVIMVYSACGGVGKTTVAMGISSCLSQSYKKVLYINASHLQTFQRLLINETPIASTDVYASLIEPSNHVYNEIKHVIRQEQFSYLPPFKASLMSLGLDFSLYEKIIVEAKNSKDYDYIVVDMECIFDENKARLLGIADKVIIVTNQNFSSVYATNILVNNIASMKNDKYIFICNKFDKLKDNAVISSDYNLYFNISDYIEYNEEYAKMKCADWTKYSDLQRITILTM